MTCTKIPLIQILTLLINLHYAESPNIVTCLVNGTAVLPFQFPFISGPDILHVSWMKMEIKDGKTTPNSICALEKNGSRHWSDQYKDRTEVRYDLSSGKLDLILKHVKKSDEGSYKCQAANEKKHGEMTIQLHVNSSVSVKYSEIMAAEGESVTFRADFSGPRTEVVWKFGEDKLVELNKNYSHYYRLADRASTSFDSASLTIRELVESDSGHYSGNILTEGKYHETKFILKVSLSVKPTEIIEEEGESVTFRTDFSGPRTEVVWKIGEDKIMELEENFTRFYRLTDRASASFHSGSLTIKELVESDSGYYSGNILAEGKYHETKFILKVSPSKPKVHYNVTDDAFTLYCESTSTGVKYEWRNSSGDLLFTEAVYTVPPDTLRFSNTMTCIVRNNMSESNSSVIVLSLPKGKTRCESSIIASCIIIPSLLLCLAAFCYIFCWVPLSKRRRNKEDTLKSSLNNPGVVVNIKNLQENLMPHKVPQFQKEPTQYAENEIL